LQDGRPTAHDARAAASPLVGYVLGCDPRTRLAPPPTNNTSQRIPTPAVKQTTRRARVCIAWGEAPLPRAHGLAASVARKPAADTSPASPAPRSWKAAELAGTSLRANPSPEVTDLFCRLPLSTFPYSTRGCSPWRPDAVMSTTCDDAVPFPGIFTVRRERSGHPAILRALFQPSPSLLQVT